MTLFVEKAEEKRGQTSIREFASDLGIDYSAWARIIKGERQVSPAIQQRILAKYPDLLVWLLKDAEAAQRGKEGVA